MNWYVKQYTGLRQVRFWRTAVASLVRFSNKKKTTDKIKLLIWWYIYAFLAFTFRMFATFEYNIHLILTNESERFVNLLLNSAGMIRLDLLCYEAG